MTDVAIVSGGAGGIGSAINRRLAASGWTVLAGDLEDVIGQQDHDSSHERIVPAPMDVRDQASVDAAVAQAVSLGTLKGIVNCAGVVRFTLAPDAAEEDIDTLWRVNVAGMARLVKAAHPHLGRRGAIVNIASLTGLMGRLRGASLYGASKAGVMAYTRYLAVELAPNVRVNALAPGYIAVPMSASMRAVSGGEDALIPTIPLARLGGVDEMADVVEFLLSDRSSYITGATIVADGGASVA
jgi:3-oxoacyl-[acyl-carrier protein] reductase